MQSASRCRRKPPNLTFFARRSRSLLDYSDSSGVARPANSVVFERDLRQPRLVVDYGFLESVLQFCCNSDALGGTRVTVDEHSSIDSERYGAGPAPKVESG